MTKKLEDILATPEAFAELLGMCLLFDKDSEYYKFSGFVTAALLDYEGNGISILAIDTHRPLPEGWITFKYTRDDLRKMFSHCIEFVGKTADDSFTLEKV